MEFEGTVVQIFEPTKGTSARGEWQRQEVLFEIQEGQYPRKVVVTFFNKEQEVKTMSVGGTYTVSINLESREYNGRWYTNAMGWRVQSKGAAAPEAPAAAMPPMPSAPLSEAPAYSSPEDVDDLPF